MMPNHFLFALALAALIPIAASAQQAGADTPAGPPGAAISTITIQAPPRGALFKVTAHGNTMHLFGTISARHRDAYPAEPILMKAIKQAPLMYLEVTDLPLLRGAWSMFSFREDAAYKGLSPDMRQRLDVLLQRHQIGAGYHLTPFALGALLVTRACPYEQEKVADIDEHLAEVARKHDVPVDGLDEEPMGTVKLVSSAMPADVKLDFLATTVATLASATPCESALERAAWLRADQAALAAAVRKMEEEDTLSGRYLRDLLRQRNAAIADKLVARLQQQDRVVAAIHYARLLMKDGLIERLQASGATVERIY